MSKRMWFSLAVLCLPLLMPVMASTQQPEPAVFTYVAEWAIPRAQWDAFQANFDKNTRPVLDRASADGTLVSWGSYATYVHLDGDVTHGFWMQSVGTGGIEKVRDQLLKNPPDPSMLAATKHRDYFLRSLLRKSRTTGPAGGYLWVGSSVVKPGKGQDWRDLWEKYTKPLYDELLANGTITFYEVQVEHVHTDDPGLRFVVYATPTADGIGKVFAAAQARTQARSAEERQAIGNAFADATVAGPHRDFMAKVSSYWVK